MRRSGIAARSAVKLARAYAQDTRGAVALILALSAILLVGVVGGAVDFARWHQAKSQIQNGIDAAVLAAGRTLQTSTDETEALQAATRYFNNMVSTSISRGAPSFTLVENGTVIRGDLNGAVSSPFLGVIGIPELPVKIRSEAVLAAGGNSGSSVEVSLMLDITGSMRGQKIVDMQAAAKDLIDIVVWDDQSQYTSRVALAPFAPRVNVGSYMHRVTNLVDRNMGGTPVRAITCVTERTGSAEFTDDAPAGNGTWISAFSGDNGAAARDNPSNFSADGECNGPTADEAIMPLTADKTSLKARIDNFTDGGTTAGALGTAWAWYLISPKWNGVWTGVASPGSYADLTTLGRNGQPKLKKYVILMTDGVYNTYGGVRHSDWSSEAVTISDKAVQICSAIKATGIKVYTVGFDLGGSTLAINTLKSCASREPGDPADQPSYFYNASTGEELRQAFRDIALQIATLRLRS